MMKVHLCTNFFSVSQCSFSAFWRDDSAISDLSSMGFIKSMILNVIVLGLEISVNTTSFSLQTGIARVVTQEYHI